MNFVSLSSSLCQSLCQTLYIFFCLCHYCLPVSLTVFLVCLFPAASISACFCRCHFFIFIFFSFKIFGATASISVFLFIYVNSLVRLVVSLALCIPLGPTALDYLTANCHATAYVCFTFFSSHNHQPSRISLLCFSPHILTSPPLCPSSWSKLTQLHVSHKKVDKKYWVRYQHPRIDLSCRKQIHNAILITSSL